MIKAKRLLSEMFLKELTPIKHAETELNMGQSVAKGPRKFTPATGKAQSDLDSASSVKKEAGEATGGLRITGDRETLSALESALEAAIDSHQLGNEDYTSWADDAKQAIATALRNPSGASQISVTLPAYSENGPNFDDYTGPGPEDEE